MGRARTTSWLLSHGARIAPCAALLSLAAAAGSAACTTSNAVAPTDAGTASDAGGPADGGAPDTGADAGTGAVSVTVSPSPAKVLTCTSQTFTATVTGSTDTSVAWSVTPASGAGSIDASGKYIAPTATPSPATAKVTATSHADPMASASADVTLATAFPSAPATIPGSLGGGVGVFPHAIATSGSRVYAVWPSAGSATPSLLVARSDDGGTTWKAAVAAVTATNTGGTDALDCAAVAIDQGSPDVVYVYGRIPDANNLGSALTGNQGDQTSVLAVSKDGGATFKTMVMEVGGVAGGPNGGWDQVGICGDVASPAPNTVVVESPGGYAGDGNPDIAIWADAQQGAGFAQGTSADGDYVANGATRALDNLQGNHDIGVAQNGGTDSAGGATESPRLFTDGAGRLCLTYYGTISGNGQSQSHVYAQCSSDVAKTFSAPLIVDPSQPAGAEISSPVGTFGPNKAAAILWTNGIGGGQLFAATSSDGGQTFGAPMAIPTYATPGSDAGGMPALNPDIAYDASGVLWIAYRPYDGGFSDRIVVDKSCDGGKTWSGPVLVNGPEGSITDMRFPAFALTPGAAPHLLATPSDHLAYFTLTP